LGYYRPVQASDDGDDDDKLPDWFEDVAEFFRLWSWIEQFGIEGAFRLLAVDGVDFEPSEEFIESLDLFNGELARLDLEDRVQEAEEQREQRRRASSRR